MANFPKIDTPCPIRWSAMPRGDRNFCTQCERKVHNLDAMTGTQRREFLNGCDGSVCVAYTVRAPRAGLGTRMGLGLAAALALGPALAEPQAFPQHSPAQSTSLTPAEDFVDCDEEKASETASDDNLVTITVGGVSNPREARWLDEGSALPVLPEVSADSFLEAPVQGDFVVAPTGNPE